MSKTDNNLKEAFTGEAKAAIRLRLFAQQAEKDGYIQIAKLFRVIAEAETVHAKRALMAMNVLKSTEENLQYSFERESSVNELTYPTFIKDALEDENKAAAILFTHGRDVEETHAALYKKALEHLMEEIETTYFLCTVCGYISDGILPDNCPICNAKKELFIQID